MLSKSDRTRQHIITTSALLFNKKGYSGTSVSDITQAAKLTKGAVYSHFANKDELARTCFDFNVQFIQNCVRKAEQIPGTAPEKLKALLNTYREIFPEVQKRGGCAIMNATAEGGEHLPLLQAGIQKSIDVWKRSLERILRQGQIEGTILQSIEVSGYATGIIAMVEGGILLSKAYGNSEPFIAVMTRLDQLFLTELYT
ncbi:MAG: TetR/AcrR family transcriptional regulator [Salibacteraceae bacterium]